MQDLLKRKLIIYFGIFGAGFALLLSVFSGSSFFLIFTRTLLGAILMGILGFGLDFFLKQTLPENDYNNLFSSNSTSLSGTNPSRQGSKNIDVIEDSDTLPGKSYDHIYTGSLESEGNEITAPVNDKSELNRTENKTADNVVNEINTKNFTTSENSQQNDVKSSLKTNKIEINSKKVSSDKSETGPSEEFSPITYEENIVKEDENYAIKDDLGRLKEAKQEEKLKKSASTPAMVGSVKFRSGNKNITADPKVIAQAIRTVLSRDE